MPAGTYIVREADYLDQQDGLTIGATVEAEPGDIGGQLRVTRIGEIDLREPIAVHATQLEAA